MEPSTGGDLTKGKIRDSNRHMLLAAVRSAGAEARDFGTTKRLWGVHGGCSTRALQ